jgi:tetratricopeptide (TPR) repeat protein
MKLRKLYRELVRRNVFRAVLAYLAVAWVLIEFSSVILPTFEAPPYVLQGLIYLLAIGLILWTIFAWIYDLTPEGWKKTPDWTDTTETRAANSRRLNAVIAVAGVTALLLLVAGSFWAGSRWNSNREVANRPAYQIAVIPFESDTKDIEDAEVFKNGLTQELIESLSGNQALLVLNMGSTQYFTAGLVPDNTYLASHTQNIDYFVSGRVEIQDNLLNVSLELRKDLSQKPIWTRGYQNDLSKIRQLWASATEDILEFIGMGTEAESSFRRELRSVNPETYELYLKGKYYLSRSTVEEWQRGLVYLQEATDRNPADPDAWASMAEGYITWGHNPMPPDDVFPKAQAASKRAIQLDSTNALGWATLADYHTYFGWDYDLADYAFRKADSLNPNMALNHYHRSWYLALFGRMNEAIREHKRAQELDPFTPMHTAWMAELYRWVGEYDLALAELDKVFEMNTGQYALAMVLKGMILTDMGRVDEGLEIMRQACEINMGWYVFYGPYLMKHGQAEEANDLLKELEALPDIPFFNLVRASTYKEAGDLDKAFEYLEKGKRHAWYAWFVRIYMADEIQQDPRFYELLSELKLPPPGPLQYNPDI